MVRVIFCFMAFLLFTDLLSQVCNGSLGDNIFTDGNFGTGDVNNLLDDPQIAPGYTYTASGPPIDGFYVITNNTAEWSSLYATWLAIGDNSSEQDGYMMVINASFDPGDFYDQTVDGLCPNTLYEFSADVINLIRKGVSGHLDPNVSFLIDGQEQYTTGNIPKTEEWQTFGFTFTTGVEQTEVKLTLRNNAPGGIGNDLALDNITFRPCGPASFINIDTEQTIFLCEEDDPLTITANIEGDENQVFSIQWQWSRDEGTTWEDIGVMNQDFIVHDRFIPDTYWYRYISASNDLNLINEKCRVFSKIIMLVVVPKISNVSDTSCIDIPFIFGDQMLTESGNYVDTFVSTLNCDSIVFLDLTVLPNPDIRIDADVMHPSCFGYQDGSITISAIDNGYPPFQITLDGIETGTELLGLADGEYKVLMVDRHHCYAEEEFIIVQPELFEISTIEDQEILLGEEIQVSTETNYQIVDASWNNVNGFSCDNCADPLIIPRVDTKYVLTAMNEEGCVARDSFAVKINKTDILFMANIFSPNGDGVNDVFYVNSFRSSVAMVNKFVILDRWGNIVFRKENFPSNDIAFGWDGRNSVEDGVYTYFLDVKLIDDTEQQMIGNITLIK